MAELSIAWQTVKTITHPEKAVVTGESTGDDVADTTQESPLLWTNMPIVVYVCDEAAGCEGFDKLEEVALKDEKVALGMKAFRRVKMHPDDVAANPVLKSEGKDVPRLLFIEPISLKVTVLEQKDHKTSKIFSTMKAVAGKFWKENLDKLVGDHIKLLTAQDQIVNAEKVIQDKMTRLRAEESKAKEKDIAELEKEQKSLHAEMAELREKQTALWKLTPKNA